MEDGKFKSLLIQILNQYFSIGDSYTYELTRVKQAFEIGTMSLDDFQEWTVENINDLADYILKHMSAKPNVIFSSQKMMN